MGKKIRKYHLRHEVWEYMKYTYGYTTIQKFSFFKEN